MLGNTGKITELIPIPDYSLTIGTVPGHTETILSTVTGFSHSCLLSLLPQAEIFLRYEKIVGDIFPPNS